MASFVRQLNMYGFRKVVHIEQGGLVKPEKDDTEFQHPYFIRGQEHLLENIKRKVTSVSSIKNEDIKVRQDNVTKLLTDIQVMKGKQESMDSKLIAMKQMDISHEDPCTATVINEHLFWLQEITNVILCLAAVSLAEAHQLTECFEKLRFGEKLPIFSE
nr:PREDICTED: heat shock factor protein 1-like isoform X3 [Apteryx mantelli mantelli]